MLLNVTTGTEITLQEMTDATDIIREKADQDAQVIWGHVFDETLGDKVRVTMIATFPEDGLSQQGRTRIAGRGDNIRPPQHPQPTQIVTGQNVPMPQPPQPQPQQVVQTPPPPRRTLFTLYEQKRRQQEGAGLEEARLTQPNPNERDAFMGMPKKIYDQPAIYRKNRKD